MEAAATVIMVTVAKERSDARVTTLSTAHAIALASTAAPDDGSRALWLAVLLDAYFSATWTEYFEQRGDGVPAPKLRSARAVQPRSLIRWRLSSWAQRLNDHRDAVEWFLDPESGCPEVCKALSFDYETVRDNVLARCPERDGRWPGGTGLEDVRG